MATAQVNAPPLPLDPLCASCHPDSQQTLLVGQLAMFERVRSWLKERDRKRLAIGRALEEFRRTHATAPMGAHVLRVGSNEVIVRVMCMTDRKPPDRFWYAVSCDGTAVRELSFEDVAGQEPPWR